MTKKRRRLILGLAAATLVLLPQFGQAQTPVELVPFEGMKDQFLISLPEGWFATNTGSAMDRGARQLGIVFFSPYDLSRVDLKAQMKVTSKILTGETPSFILYRAREPKGAKCEGFSERGEEEVIQMIGNHRVLWEGMEKAKFLTLLDCVYLDRRLQAGAGYRCWETALGLGWSSALLALIGSPSLVLGADSEVLEPFRAERIFVGGCRALRLRGRSRGADGAEWVTDIYAAARFGVLYLFALRNKKEYYEDNLETYEKAMRTVKLTVRSATEGDSSRPLPYLGPESYWRYAEYFRSINKETRRKTLTATPELSQPLSTTEVEMPTDFVVFDDLKEQFTMALPAGWRVYEFLSEDFSSVVFTTQEIAKPGEVPEVETGLKLDRGSVPSIIVELFPAGKNMSCRDLTKKGAARAANFVEESPGFSGEVHYPWRPKKKPIPQIGGCQGYNIHFKAWLGEPTSGTEWIVDVRAVSDGKTLYLISHRSTPAYYKRNLEKFEEVLATFRLSSPQ